MIILMIGIIIGIYYAYYLFIPEQKHTLIIRSHNPTEKMVQRILNYVKELAPKGVCVWISLDTTQAIFHDAQKRLTETLRKQFKENKHYWIHRYSEQDLVQTFPTLNQIEVLQKQRQQLWDTNRSLAWAFHWEPLSLLSQNPKFKKQLGSSKFVWVIEDDIGYTGNFYHLLQKYESVDADVLTRESRIIDPKEKWPWYNTVSDSYAQLIGNQPRYFSSEHCQRFSKQYFDKWVQLNHEGVHAWSEQATPTMCKALGFKLQDFESIDVSEYYASNVTVSEQEWLRFIQDDSQKNKLFHALKF